MNDLFIKNGIIVTEDGVKSCNLVINAGKITEITANKDIAADKIIDATGLHLFPGLIDAHMHVQAPFQGITGQLTFWQQSIAAAFGGVTCFADFTNTQKGDSVIAKVKERLLEMQESAIDYFVHGKFVNPSDEVIAEIPELARIGVPTFKMFMTYSREKVITNDLALYKIFNMTAKYNCLPMVHAESDAIADYNFTNAIKNNMLSWRDFANCKPINCELEAFQKAVLMAVEAKSPLLIVHTTNKPCLDYAEKYQQLGHKIYVETCPHYLTLFSDLYDDPKLGHLAMCSPPLRTKKEAKDLIAGLKNGVISLTGSDDCTFTSFEKERFLEKDSDNNYIQDFRKVVNGISGLELRLPILLTEGYHTQQLDLVKISQVTATNVAKIYGLYPQKGSLQVGADADIAFVDINADWTISLNDLHNGADYSLHAGYQAKGKVMATMLRGQYIMLDNQFVGRKNNGEFIKRYLK